MSETSDLEQDVQSIVDAGAQTGYELRSTFTVEHFLVLVFLKEG
ncbi:hypothetical protein [Elongatibacter sediminis]